MRNNPTVDEIRRVSQHLRVHKQVKEASGPHVIADCPSCGKQKHLYLNLDTGAWDCKRCDSSGGLFALADLIGLRVREKPIVRSATAMMMAGARLKQRKKDGPGLSMDKVETAHARLMDPDAADGAKVLTYLRERGFTDDTLEHFKVGLSYIREKGSKAEPAIGIPYLERGRVPMLKMRNCTQPRKYRRTKGGHSGLFHADGVRDRRQVILVEGELDAMSLWQLGATAVASTSLGAKKDIPQEWKETIEAADDVVLWYDDDDAGQEAVQGLLQALGTHRCRVAVIPEDLSDRVRAKTGEEPKDANDLLRAGVSDEEVASIINGALPVETANIVTPDAYNDHILEQIEGGSDSLGMPTTYDGLDRLLRGWRGKELTVLTGHTSHGKSTWGSDALGALARQGVPVLASSFEDGPPVLARKLFTRLFKRPISSIRTDADRLAATEALSQMNRDPFYIIDRYGRVTWEETADAIRYAVHRLGVKVVLLDHLHFFSKSNPRMEEREFLDWVMMEAKALTVELDCHIVLVAHPRGSVDLSVVPTGADVKGTSSVKQIADNVISIYRVQDDFGSAARGRMKLKDSTGRKIELDLNPDDVLGLLSKARHDEAGQGSWLMRFDSRTLRYRDNGQEAEQAVEVAPPITGGDPFDDYVDPI